MYRKRFLIYIYLTHTHTHINGMYRNAEGVWGSSACGCKCCVKEGGRASKVPSLRALLLQIWYKSTKIYAARRSSAADQLAVGRMRMWRRVRLLTYAGVCCSAADPLAVVRKLVDVEKSVRAQAKALVETDKVRP